MAHSDQIFSNIAFSWEGDGTMGRFGLIETGSDSWMLLRTQVQNAAAAGQAGFAVEALQSNKEVAIANLRKTSAHPELWFFQSVGDPHMVPIIASDHFSACKKYLLQIEEREIQKDDLIWFT